MIDISRLNEAEAEVQRPKNSQEQQEKSEKSIEQQAQDEIFKYKMITYAWKKYTGQDITMEQYIEYRKIYSLKNKYFLKNGIRTKEIKSITDVLLAMGYRYDEVINLWIR